jgi:hypothetical protein
MRNPYAIHWISHMRRTAQIVTPLLAAAAMSIMTGCRPAEMQRCVDENGTVVDDKLCGGQPQTVMHQQSDGHGGFVPIFIPMYRYYYGGGGGYGLGSRVSGGGFIPLQNRDYRNATGGGRGGGGFFGGIRSGISRGGFGSSFGGGGE